MGLAIFSFFYISFQSLGTDVSFSELVSPYPTFPEISCIQYIVLQELTWQLIYVLFQELWSSVKLECQTVVSYTENFRRNALSNLKPSCSGIMIRVRWVGLRQKLVQPKTGANNPYWSKTNLSYSALVNIVFFFEHNLLLKYNVLYFCRSSYLENSFINLNCHVLYYIRCIWIVFLIDNGLDGCPS